MSKKSIAQQIAEHLEHFVIYVSSPWRLIWINLLAGIFRGLGAIIGATLIVALLLWILSIFANLPFIGTYFNQFEQKIISHLKAINYKDELHNLEQSLKRIEDRLPPKPE